MTLLDAAAMMEQADHDLTIYATQPWTPQSPALLEREPEDGGLPAAAAEAGAAYFLEVSIARELLEALPGAPALELCLRLIQYAETDA